MTPPLNQGMAKPTFVFPGTPDAISLLLFLETCAVDGRGRVSQDRLTVEEFETAVAWSDAGFIGFGRVTYATIHREGRVGYTSWVTLSDAAWKMAAFHRRERAMFGLERRAWISTGEIRIPPEIPPFLPEIVAQDLQTVAAAKSGTADKKKRRHG